MEWEKAIALEALKAKGGKAVVRVGGRSLALFEEAGEYFAIDNRCPHEGYPLAEGTTDGKCILTCNWHNWKFDLRSGECIVGADDVNTYPIKIEGNTLFVDPTGPSPEQAEKKLMKALRVAFDKRQYGRIARELTRMDFEGLDPAHAVRNAIVWSHERFEYGMTHAHAASADWLSLCARAQDREDRIICLTESFDHLADDALRQPRFPYATEARPWEAEAFLEAIEDERESDAIALIRGASDAGMSWNELEETFTAAALAHCNDFGHSLIYVQKTGELIQQLGSEVQLPLLLLLTRSICFAWREDLIPEFRGYRPTLDGLPQFGSDRSEFDDYRGALEGLPPFGAARPQDLEIAGLVGAGIGKALKLTAGRVTDWAPEALHEAVLRACAENMLRFDTRRSLEPHQSVHDGKSWLSFSHSLTFAHAARVLCARYPRFWGAAILQMACFVGRNASAIDRELNLEEWFVEDKAAFRTEILGMVQDHGCGRPIISAHLLKTALAVFVMAEETAAPTARLLRGALNRFFHSRIKDKQARRIAYQAIKLVKLDYPQES